MTDDEFQNLAVRIRDLFKEVRSSMPEVRAYVQRPRWVGTANEGHSAYDLVLDTRGTFQFHARDALQRTASVPTVVADVAAAATFRGYASERWQRSDGADTSEFAARSFVTGILCAICNDEGAIDEEVWQRVCSEAQDLLVQGRVPFRLIMPLYGLAVSEPIDLGGISLRPADEADRSRFPMRESGVPGPIACEAVLEFRDRRPPQARSSAAPEARQLDDAHRALNVWCTWSVMPAHVQTIGLLTEGFSAVSNRETPRFPPPAHQLEDAEGFRRFWIQSREVIARPPSGLDVALSRHQLMKDQPRATDRVLDQAIILEALFLKDGEKQELSYRLALRAAHFVGDTLQERQHVNSTVREAYVLRSKIAHGDKPDARDNTVQSSLDQVVRKALIRFCLEAAHERGTKLQERICDRMDTYVLERAGMEGKSY
jgi:hypothetical protein